MKICYVAIDLALSELTGGSTHTLEMSDALLKQNNNVYLVSRRKKGQAKKVMIHSIENTQIYRFIFFASPSDLSKSVAPADVRVNGFLKSIYHLYLRTFYALYAATEISKIIKTYNVQVVFDRGTCLGAGAIAAKLTHRPLIVEVISDFYSTFSLKTAKKILAYSLDVLPNWVPRSKVVEVTAAVNTQMFNPSVDGNSIRRKYSLNNKFVIAYCGSFLDFHGVDTIIEASKDVIAKHQQSIFLMIGPNYQYYESYAKKAGVGNHFVFTGPVPYNDVPQFLASADVLVAPYSTLITSPLKLFEYLALKKPVIASKFPLIENIIDNYQTGLLTSPSDSKDLSNRINELLENPELAKQIAKNGYEFIKGKYTWDSLAQTVEQCAKK